ncbi:MAG: chemotaxis protein CheW [Pseudomonadales bacterium]|jgi:purine-binding chemotaxis protein CheW|uniref:chemotaxis protein CheW n=1 Tax=unclassified Ketobacter TaxID=2639109 RepID=UPI000C8D329A|nr:MULTISPECIES: chemotaxis protein CheW [unclassified Ketobacter]MAQ23509.1 chemotaxis protein CheW [Pseudomonadales bacterium]MEC8813344.1 chemotaxis protein CheW [Pseudomonadota bacterium]TNC89325.1 MAG: chemotaxis protein CheW [Alcanivorax sp.]HAG94618.1 chemotaxis protein CheW [Gammaproteobacteria bacterium]MCK5791755.1 chemotaxis protein CheW [Ketobacter sp.]|tara:strand:- start:4362 stop:4883 length:522 start_codon:yes stop_codon:yes gene_type:complete
MNVQQIVADDADAAGENANAKQFLTFRIGKEYFGIELEQTREILEYTGVTEVPLMPSFLSGVINLRGEMVPVIDLAVRLGRAPIQVQRRTCIIVVEIHAQDQDHVLGLLADGVSEVVEIPHQEIEKAPSFGSNIRAEFIHGIAKRDNQFVVLLDAANALSVNELAHLVETELQ